MLQILDVVQRAFSHKDRQRTNEIVHAVGGVQLKPLATPPMRFKMGMQTGLNRAQFRERIDPDFIHFFKIQFIQVATTG